MYYVCQLMFEKGQRLPRWQTAFGNRFAGVLVIAYEHVDAGFRLPVARFQPLPGQALPELWPKPLFGVSQLEEDREARFLSGSELNRSVTADRYMTQIWKLSPLPLDQLREVIAFETDQEQRQREAVNNPKS